VKQENKTNLVSGKAKILNLVCYSNQSWFLEFFDGEGCQI